MPPHSILLCSDRHSSIDTAWSGAPLFHSKLLTPCFLCSSVWIVPAIEHSLLPTPPLHFGSPLLEWVVLNPLRSSSILKWRTSIPNHRSSILNGHFWIPVWCSSLANRSISISFLADYPHFSALHHWDRDCLIRVWAPLAGYGLVCFILYSIPTLRHYSIPIGTSHQILALLHLIQLSSIIFSVHLITTQELLIWHSSFLGSYSCTSHHSSRILHRPAAMLFLGIVLFWNWLFLV